MITIYLDHNVFSTFWLTMSLKFARFDFFRHHFSHRLIHFHGNNLLLCLWQWCIIKAFLRKRRWWTFLLENIPAAISVRRTRLRVHQWPTVREHDCMIAERQRIAENQENIPPYASNLQKVTNLRIGNARCAKLRTNLPKRAIQVVEMDIYTN